MKCERCKARKAGLQIVNSNLAVMLAGKKPIEDVCEKCWAAEVRNAGKTFVVVRACCTSGNCIVCRERAPFGTSVEVEHFRTEDEELAGIIAGNWKLYHAEVRELVS